MRALPYIEQLAPYIAGKHDAAVAAANGLAVADILKLNSNESLWGASPKVAEALRLLLTERPLHYYPDSDGVSLKTALAAHHDVSANTIVLGNGSNDLLDMVARAYLNQDGASIYAQYSFAVYAIASQAQGATHRAISVADDFSVNLDDILRAVSEHPNTRVVFLANPNNPTGSFIEGAAIKAFLEALPADVLLVLDEAYSEFICTPYDSTAWLVDHPNLIICRTFSKAYGLASLRIGYGLMHADIAARLNRVRHPFNANRFAQTAAIAAVADQAFMAGMIREFHAAKAELEQGLRALAHLHTYPSEGNFFCVRFATSTTAERIIAGLTREGMLIRPLANYGLNDCARITIGRPADNARLLTVLAHLF